jgi:glycine cleavage system transcriptional repressor
VTERTVLAAVGADRPGLVEEVSEFVLARGGSIEDSRMANLQGQFAIIMLVAGGADTPARLAADAGVLHGMGLSVQLTAAAEAPAAAPAQRYRLTGQALDQPGLVHQVANVLRGFGVNIESLDTTLGAAPETGAPVFALDALVSIPESTSLPELRDALARACDQLNIDWRLETV